MLKNFNEQFDLIKHKYRRGDGLIVYEMVKHKYKYHTVLAQLGLSGKGRTTSQEVFEAFQKVVEARESLIDQS